MQFQYRATDFQGKIIEGSIEAGEERAAVLRLQQRGLIPIRIGAGSAPVPAPRSQFGGWTARAEWEHAGRREAVAGAREHAYATEEDARRAALSAATAAIDRARASRGKP